MNEQRLLPRLRRIGAELESLFGDMCEFEFTVQDGELYLMDAYVGKRTPKAAIRIAIDLFLEGRITGKSLLSRIEPAQVEEMLLPSVIINPKIREMGAGIAASPGVAKGIAAFSSESAICAAAKGDRAVLLVSEVTPEDIQGIEASVGVVSFLGGMTGHAGIVCRGIRKPCVAGIGWTLDQLGCVVHTRDTNIEEGDQLTIDGSSGVIYAGWADVITPDVHHDERLLLLVRIAEALSAEGELPDQSVGKAWRIRDIILNGASRSSRQANAGRLLAGLSETPIQGKAFRSLEVKQVEQLSEELSSFRLDGDRSDAIEIWAGLREFLLRQLSKNVGIGRHPAFWRPMFAPCQTVMNKRDHPLWNSREGSKVQLVGEEFFSINYYVPELIDVASIRIYWAVECSPGCHLWRLDRTNPGGEKLLEGSGDLRAVKYVVNGATIPRADIGAFYNSIRRREYCWNWYGANEVSRREIVDSLKNREGTTGRRARELARHAGLISWQSELTEVGDSLLHPANAAERATMSIRIGW